MNDTLNYIHQRNMGSEESNHVNQTGHNNKSQAIHKTDSEICDVY